jgi:hypothetical protein
MKGSRINLIDMPTAFPWAQVLTTEERDRVEAELFIRYVRKGKYAGRRGEPVSTGSEGWMVW